MKLNVKFGEIELTSFKPINSTLHVRFRNKSGAALQKWKAAAAANEPGCKEDLILGNTVYTGVYVQCLNLPMKAAILNFLSNRPL